MVLPYLRLVRVGTLFSPAADVTAGLCLAGLPWTREAVQALAASVMVYAAGMVLNDHADRRRDATTRPERPLPAGQISPTVALLLGVSLMIAGVAVSPSPAYYAVIAALVLAYDYLLKRSALGGAINMGVLRGLNLTAGAVAVSGAAPPRVVLIAAAAYGLYIIAVTLLGILEDHGVVKRRVAVSIQAVPPLVASLALLGMPKPWPAAAIAFALAAVFFLGLRGVGTWDRAAVRGSMTKLLLGTMLYTALLCLSSEPERWVECVVVAAAVVPARWISRRIALT